MQYSSFYHLTPVPNPEKSGRKTVSVELFGMSPTCLSETCHLQKDCASHCSAGDFRSEDGFTPDLRPEDVNTWTCSQKETDSLGMLIWDKKIRGYRAWEGLMRERFEDAILD